MSDRVSVIIPTFNREWSVVDALKSVLDQDYSSEIEIIVVDDGSTDNTFELLKQFERDTLSSGSKNNLSENESLHYKNTLLSKKNIKIIRQTNKGVSAARNFGIKESKGDFIAFLDSDDLWLPNKLSCQIDFFHKNPDAMICQTEEIWIRNGKRVNPKNRHKKLSGMIFEPSLHLCLVSPSAVMMRREFFDIKGFFDENLIACEDYDLWLRTSVDMPIWLVDKPCIIKKGGHADQLSSNHSLDKYRIKSIQNLLNSPNIALSDKQKIAAMNVLKEKCEIYKQGCLKRGKAVNEDYCVEKYLPDS
ncbi:MAG: glycosyltransferase family 2 protein [Desulfamplus sp.]|nr:glycosyltransferase family 2 protein [Desulfamplus sp.]